MSSSPAEIIPYGEWPSPIAAADVARGHVRLSFPTSTGDAVWWQESRPAEGGRQTVVRTGPDGISQDILPAPWNARTRVHEYGGRSYLPLPGGLLFANFSDQRLYLVPGGGEPTPLTAGGPGLPATGETDALAAGDGDRFADFAPAPWADEVLCVRERHADGRITRAIVAVPLDGSAATDPDAVRVLVTGSDFFAFPTPSPDGTALAWICWDHPRMPWDGTELRVAPIGDPHDGASGEVGRYRVIMGSETESVIAPTWRDERSLYVLSDRSGWWNLYLADAADLADTADLADGGDADRAEPVALCPREEEFATPLWQLGTRAYAVLGDGRLAVTHGTGERRLAVLDPDTGELTDVDVPYRVFSPGSVCGLAVCGQPTAGQPAPGEPASGQAASGQAAYGQAGRVVTGLAGGPATPLSVVQVDVDQATIAEVRREANSLPEAGYLPVPRTERLTGPSGSIVHAVVYPPANPVAVAPDGESPPYIVWVHGGPTSRVYPLFDLEKAYFTSRGIGVIDVNYGGSSGYGRAYRERLRGQWGIVDVVDCVTAALALADAGEADPKRLGIRGGSAGGWTTLAAVTSGLGLGAEGSDSRAVFATAVSYFGVSDLRGFAAMTHDFESRYLDGLIGPLPQAAALYAARAPVGHVREDTCPVLLLQGLDDPVVPPAQAESIARDLAEHGIPHAYLAFPGESHGFRMAATITAALEAELSFYGQVMGFTPPGVPPLQLSGN